MPSGIYKRKKKKAKATIKATSKRKPGRPKKTAKKRGRPPGRKTKSPRRTRAANKDTPSHGLEALIEALHAVASLFEARSTLLIGALHGISDAIRGDSDRLPPNEPAAAQDNGIRTEEPLEGPGAEPTLS